MSKIDIYKALEILDKFDFFQGQRAGRELWAEKPFDVQEEDLKNFSLDVQLLKTYIEESASETKLLYVELGNANSEILRLIEEKKELTEENERLKKLNGKLQSKYLDKSLAYNELWEELDETKADTVRKMQTEIEARCIEGGIYPAFVKNVVNQVAEEILSGNTPQNNKK